MARPTAMLRRLRLLALLTLLVFVALGTWLDRVQSTDWDGPLTVALYPVNADGSAAADLEISRGMTLATAALTTFFDREARRHGLPLERPLRFTVAPGATGTPPLPPEPGSGALATIAWSLRLRWWNFRIDDPPGPTPTIRLYLLFHDPASTPRVPHSAGLRKGLLGIAHLFAVPHMSGSNQVVIAHELLHTLGATDKYDPATNQPRDPDGLAEPTRMPRYPQALAELMAGRIPESAASARMPESLDEVLVGDLTAAEIGWSAAP